MSLFEKVDHYKMPKAIAKEEEDDKILEDTYQALLLGERTPEVDRMLIDIIDTAAPRWNRKPQWRERLLDTPYGADWLAYIDDCYLYSRADREGKNLAFVEAINLRLNKLRRMICGRLNNKESTSISYLLLFLSEITSSITDWEMNYYRDLFLYEDSLRVGKKAPLVAVIKWKLLRAVQVIGNAYINYRNDHAR